MIGSLRVAGHDTPRQVMPWEHRFPRQYKGSNHDLPQRACFASAPLAGQIAGLGIGAAAFVFSTTQTAKHIDDIAELIAPQGRLCFVDGPPAMDIMNFMRKSISIHHELMFTRSIFGTPDIDAQRKILIEIAIARDDGRIRSTANQRLGTINAANLKKAHAQLESGSTIVKVVLESFA